MVIMKKILFFAAVLAFVGISNAQQKSQSAQSTQVVVKNNFDEWSKELKLTDSQISQIKAIEEKYRAEKDKIRNTGTAADFKAINDRKQKEINALLTPEQLKLDEALKVRKEQEKQANAALKSK
jgi:Spy/CpxP family protein refolding chaperone